MVLRIVGCVDGARPLLSIHSTKVQTSWVVLRGDPGRLDRSISRRRVRQRVKPGRILGLWEPYGICSGIIQSLARKQDNRGFETPGGRDRKPRG